MNRIGESNSDHRRLKRVVSLPCGHQVYVDLDASMLAVSGPVLDHQATCRPERPPVFAAWFSVGPVPRGSSDSPGPRSSGPLGA
jgi:hypothetical protein